MSNLIIFGNPTKTCCEKTDDDCSLVFQFISFSCAIHALLCLCAYANAKNKVLQDRWNRGRGAITPLSPLLILAEIEAHSTTNTLNYQLPLQISRPSTGSVLYHKSSSCDSVMNNFVNY